MSAVVVRLSGSSIIGTTFSLFSRNTRQWAENSGWDRIDHPRQEIGPDTCGGDLLRLITTMGQPNPSSTDVLVVGVPGPVNTSQDVLYCPQLPALAKDGGSLLRCGLGRMWSGPIVIANNTNLLAEAERAQGAARSLCSTLVVTLGSGIGAAFILDGRVYTGKSGLAGEIGHIVIDPDGPQCECGQKGCLERYVSGDALMWFAKERNIVVEKPSELTTVPEAEEFVAQARELLAQQLFNVIKPLGFQQILVGGMLAELFGPKQLAQIINSIRAPFMDDIGVRRCQFSPAEGVLVGGGQIGLRLQAELASQKLPSPLRLTTR